MAARRLVYFGNYTRGDDAAVYYGQIDPSSGAIQALGKVSCPDAPSYLALNPAGTHLYVLSEVGEGAVSAFAIDADSGGLTLLNTQPTGGSPCHNVVDATGRYVLSANYGGGSVSMHPIAADGSLGEMSDFRQHEGSSVNPDRQKEPHAHSINIDPSNRYAFCADLGLDKVLIYKLDLEAGKLLDHAAADVTPGAGPRHFAVHPNRRKAYVINEIGNTITAFDWDETAGSLTELQQITTIPDDYSETTHTADIHVTPDGGTLYGSNRGHDSVAVYSIADDGTLTARGHQQVPATPRNFAVDADGAYLYSGGQNTDSVPVFRIGADGSLSATGDVFDTPSPVCIKFLDQS